MYSQKNMLINLSNLPTAFLIVFKIFIVLKEAQNFFFGFGDTKTDREACRQHRVVIGNILLHATGHNIYVLKLAHV